MTTGNNQDPKDNDSISYFFFSLVRKIWDFLVGTFDLKNGMDREGAILEIRNNKKMQGANAWLLMCSIMVASLGLDLNSPAVIIGAMLISPLMSPILGVGLAIGINDRNMLMISLRHFSISIGISLVTSFLYFKLTPIGQLTPEILNRTAPTFLDALIAFFGGLAGIISNTRKDKSNAIPGVAIATALMPPLCVTGFGLAKGDWMVMINSFYLFFLNAVIVAFATYLIVRILNFPSMQHANDREKRKAKAWGVLLGLLLLVPSFIILSNILSKLNDRSSVEEFMDRHFVEDIWQIQEKPKSDTLDAQVIVFRELTEDSIAYYENLFADLNVRGRFHLIQSNVPLDDSELEQMKINMRSELLELLQADKKYADEKSRQIAFLETQIDSILNPSNRFMLVAQELKTLYPKLKSCSYADMQYSIGDSIVVLPTLNVSWENTNKYQRIRMEDQIGGFMKIRMAEDTVVIKSTF
ncbi:MAG: TIGR00341 family protein [Saprospiraceae bacterium]|nr:TIGR00341 family protein [Saprospiraceae bacterium]